MKWSNLKIILCTEQTQKFCELVCVLHLACGYGTPIGGCSCLCYLYTERKVADLLSVVLLLYTLELILI